MPVCPCCRSDILLLNKEFKERKLSSSILLVDMKTNRNYRGLSGRLPFNIHSSHFGSSHSQFPESFLNTQVIQSIDERSSNSSKWDILKVLRAINIKAFINKYFIFLFITQKTLGSFSKIIKIFSFHNASSHNMTSYIISAWKRIREWENRRGRTDVFKTRFAALKFIYFFLITDIAFSIQYKNELNSSNSTK